MKKLVSVFPLLLIVLVLGGNFGLREFIHKCTVSGVSHSYILPETDHCPDKKEASCCKTKQEVPKEKKSCCHSTEKIYQLKFDDFRQHVPAFSIVAIEIATEHTFVSTERKIVSQNDFSVNPANGPPLTGFERCIRYCVYRL